MPQDILGEFLKTNAHFFKVIGNIKKYTCKQLFITKTSNY